MLFHSILSEAGRSTLVPITSLSIKLIDLMPFGINLNLVAELGQLCNIDLRFVITTILLVHLLFKIVNSTVNLFTIAPFRGDSVSSPLFTSPSSFNGRLVTYVHKTQERLCSIPCSWSRFVPLTPLQPNHTKHTLIGPIFHFFHLLNQHLFHSCTLFMINGDPQQSNNFADKYNTSIGLQEYNPSTPPGWKPGLKNFPFRKYLQKMQLWNTIKSCNNDQVGPLVAGRLCGAAFQIAMHLRIQRSDGTVLIGPDAVAAPAISSSTHTGDRSGGKQLMDRLIEEYGIHDQEQTTMALDQFFNHTREGHDLSSYLTVWRLYLEEAIELGGLQLTTLQSHIFS